MSKIRIVHMYTKVKGLGGKIIDTTSRSGQWAGLSPFNLGPCQLYGKFTSQNMENAWQYSKVYKRHTDEKNNPTEQYWDWAVAGWNSLKPHRYPMGKGAVPEYSLWNDEKLGYIDARKKIYAPLYAQAVQQTPSWRRLKETYESEDLIILRDFDGYDHEKLELTLTDVLNNPSKKMGHAFVLAMLLQKDEALKQLTGKYMP